MRRPVIAAPAAPKPRTVRRPVTASPPKAATSYGVDPEAAERARVAMLSNESNDDSQPYCTCRSVTGGFAFDPQIGVYLHSVCWKPSKAYYMAARSAGIITMKEQ